MALPVIESLSKLDFHRIWQFVCDPTPGRLGFALRMAAACTVTVLVCEIWQVPDLGVPALVMMAIWQKDRVTNVLIGVVLNIIVLFLLLSIYGIVKFAYDNTVIYVSCIATISFFFFLYGLSQQAQADFLSSGNYHCFWPDCSGRSACGRNYHTGNALHIFVYPCAWRGHDCSGFFDLPFTTQDCNG
ncbi:MAG: hypothetical protein LKH33_08175 [Acetobacter sp.]|nr:hypothetical protein [Acetobacter sp.]MCH4061839.1 hypothetical protein [Acetobacter sp.]MCH4089312.1 hypothetical protein [Acetobacter sp.]MCI1294210.1 hypothetical protein [Acetobacter sp.]MCI1320795.1 hypothetical protein [Acetobacter sp.]